MVRTSDDKKAFYLYNDYMICWQNMSLRKGAERQ